MSIEQALREIEGLEDDIKAMEGKHRKEISALRFSYALKDKIRIKGIDTSTPFFSDKVESVKKQINSIVIVNEDNSLTSSEGRPHVTYNHKSYKNIDELTEDVVSDMQRKIKDYNRGTTDKQIEKEVDKPTINNLTNATPAAREMYERIKKK